MNRFQTFEIPMKKVLSFTLDMQINFINYIFIFEEIIYSFIRSIDANIGTSSTLGGGVSLGTILFHHRRSIPVLFRRIMYLSFLLP